MRYLSICFEVLGYIAFCLNMSLSMFSNADVVHASLVLCEYHFRSLICCNDLLFFDNILFWDYFH